MVCLFIKKLPKSGEQCHHNGTLWLKSGKMRERVCVLPFSTALYSATQWTLREVPWQTICGNPPPPPLTFSHRHTHIYTYVCAQAYTHTWSKVDTNNLKMIDRFTKNWHVNLVQTKLNWQIQTNWKLKMGQTFAKRIIYVPTWPNRKMKMVNTYTKIFFFFYYLSGCILQLDKYSICRHLLKVFTQLCLDWCKHILMEL